MAGASSVPFGFDRESRVYRLVGIRADMEVGTMMIGVAAVRVEAVRRHELDHLQRAFGAVDIRNVDVGFLFLLERRGMHEQAVGKNGRRRRILDRGRYRSRTAICGAVPFDTRGGV